MERSGNPAPCSEVDARDGYAVLKDKRGRFQFLLIPTARISGIEDPVLLSANVPNYWRDAWQARRFVDARIGRLLPRDAIALTVNAVTGRSQNQLHIHVDCVRPDVRAELQAHAAAIGSEWTPFPVPLGEQQYLARKVASADLNGVNPFRLLAELPEARRNPGYETLVVAGAVFPDGSPGFYLLADHADPARGDLAHGESLQDHACALTGSE